MATITHDCGAPMMLMSIILPLIKTEVFPKACDFLQDNRQISLYISNTKSVRSRLTTSEASFRACKWVFI